jgi:transposase
MRYLGLDVHAKATVWCLFDESGLEVGHGKIETTAEAIRALLKRLRGEEEIVVGQEVGTLARFVYDVLTSAGVRVLSFNAQQMRMIASSRKKTDRRDAYWIAKALQTGMTPHPVYIPTGQVRRVRSLLSQHDALQRERTRWLLRARSYLRAAGCPVPKSGRSVERLLRLTLERPEGLDTEVAEAVELCGRNERSLAQELKRSSAAIRAEIKDVEAIKQLQTIPAVGPKVAVHIWAWVGDITRFPSARQLASYAGLVPSVWQSGETNRTGGITSQGSPALRRVLVQAGHVLLGRCPDEKAGPLKQIALHVQTTRGKRKIAVVAAARHILRIAFYVLRDQTTYNPALLKVVPKEQETRA